MSFGNTSRATSTTRRAGRRARRTAAVTAASAGAAFLAMTLSGALAAGASAAARTNCQAVPHACGFRDATNTGPRSGMTLKAVPGQVSRGKGWRYNASAGAVEVTGNGAVLSGLSITGAVNITASRVTMNNDRVVTGNNWGISLRHTARDTIENTRIRGVNAGSRRVDTAISDRYGDSTGILVKNNNISQARSGIQVATGTVTGNYIHNPGYITGDHTNGVIANGGTGKLTISHNTILNSLSQTDAITIDTHQVAGPVTHKTIRNNLVAGGGYPVYGGSAFGHATASIVIQGNRFGQGFYARSGKFGPAAYYSSAGAGNTWTGNTWDSTGSPVGAPRPHRG